MVKSIQTSKLNEYFKNQVSYARTSSTNEITSIM